MGTTPLWVPLAVAVIAVLGTISGVVFTQVWNSHLEERRSVREDLNRTYEHRRTAYVEFYEEFANLQTLLLSNQDSEDFEGFAMGDPVYYEIQHRHMLIRIYGTPEAASLAFSCLGSLYLWGDHPGNRDFASRANNSEPRQ
jgi:hypothetical protein